MWKRPFESKGKGRWEGQVLVLNDKTFQEWRYSWLLGGPILYHPQKKRQPMVNRWLGVPVVWIPRILLWKGLGFLGVSDSNPKPPGTKSPTNPW